MEVTRGRKLPGNATILSETFEVKLSDADLAQAERDLPLKQRSKVLIFNAELALFTQMHAAQVMGPDETKQWMELLQKSKEALGIAPPPAKP